jgi:uncharacterized protein YecE (DUF72 family)
MGRRFFNWAGLFGFSRFGALELFLRGLPRDWPWAVEVRHHDWFDAADCENRLDGLLEELEIDRVLFDSRPLHSLDASDAIEEVSQKRKPKSPFRTTTTSKRPMLRLIGRNDYREVTEYWRQWAVRFARTSREPLTRIACIVSARALLICRTNSSEVTIGRP